MEINFVMRVLYMLQYQFKKCSKFLGSPCYMSEAQNGKHKDVVWQVNYKTGALPVLRDH